MDHSRSRAAARRGRHSRRARPVRTPRRAEPLFRRSASRRRSARGDPGRLLDRRHRRQLAAVDGDGAPRRRPPEARMLMRVDRVAALRGREFARLDRTRTAYLDYTGAALYPASLVRRDARRLQAAVRGNPHADSGPSFASTEAIERARALTLEFANADPSVYDVVFTANASGAIRLLAEAFPFDRRSRLVLSADNHNSVN